MHDENPKIGHNYYRLEQVDIDGKRSLHSKVVDVWHSAMGHHISIYPNPANQLVHVDFYAEKVGNAQVKLTDVSGRVVKQLQAKSMQGLNQLELGLESVAPGVYQVQVFINNQLLQTSSLVKSTD